MSRSAAVLATVVLCLPRGVAGEMVLVTAEEGLYALSDGQSLRVGRAGGEEADVELPPGSVIHQLTRLTGGWLAAGQLPTRDGTDLLVIASRQGHVDLLPVPATSGARVRGQPVGFVEGGKLVGLAWAAGSRQDDLEIFASRWMGEQWSTPVMVSPRGPGSQLAPRAAVLHDGSWLLVWTAFDGGDDEIFWSRRVADLWTEPQRVHPDNQVPDITPTLAVLAAGAVVVWSTFDGNDYRLRSARLVDTGWVVDGRFGERGALWPDLQRHGDQLTLLYQTVVPASWTVAEIDTAGQRRRQARVHTMVSERPLVSLRGSEGVALTWITDPITGQTPRRQVAEWQELP